MEDEINAQVVEQSSSNDGDLIAEATARIVRAVGRTDSVLSLSSEEGDDDLTSTSRSRRSDSSFVYMQDASMEVDYDRDKIRPSGPLGYRRVSMYSSTRSSDATATSSGTTNGGNDNMYEAEGDVETFQSVFGSGSTRASSILTSIPSADDNGEQQEDENEGDSNSSEPIMKSTESILTLCGALPLSVAQLFSYSKQSEAALVQALIQARDTGAAMSPSQTNVEVNPELNRDDDALLLYSLFATFCTPPPSLDSVSQILNMESAMSSNGLSNWHEHATRRFLHSQTEAEVDDYLTAEIELPTDVVITFSSKQKSAVINLLCNNPKKHLLRLSTPFQMAFFRILIRLLTNESDSEYNDENFFTCSWWQEEAEHSTARHQEPSSSNGQFVNKVIPPPPTLLRRETSTMERMKVAQRANQIYSIVRFRCSADWSSNKETTTTGSSNMSSNFTLGDGSAVTCLLRLLTSLLQDASNHEHLIAPVVRLIGLLSTAGISVAELRSIMSLTTNPPRDKTHDLHVPPFAKLLMIRAISTAAEGASQLTQGKASPRHFFTFGCGKGLVRSLNSLTSWPFRNDFGMAVWFRAESFDNRQATLLSIKTQTGGGIEVSLEPLEENANKLGNVAVLAVTVYNSNTNQVQGRVVLKNCVLLQRVWYHVAIRHTRSRLQGVFSLSTRQQISIMLDGKLMLTEDLKFPEFSSDHVGGPSSKLLSPAIRRGSRAKDDSSLRLTVTFTSQFEGQTGPLYVFHDHVSEGTLRALYKNTGGTNGLVKQESLADDEWDSARGEIAKRVNAVGSMSNDDAEEVIVTMHENGPLMDGPHKMPRVSTQSASVLDLVDADVHEENGFPVELSRPSFGSKLFLVWDPGRTERHVALELHAGAHVEMDLDQVQPWHVVGAKQLIGSLGGVQSILPTFRDLLSGQIEKLFDTELKRGPLDCTFNEAILATTVPTLLNLLAAFVRSHRENAREALRCGAIDIVEQLLLSNKMNGANGSASNDEKRTLINMYHIHSALSRLLVEALLDLRLASSHDVGLEANVLARLIFNVPLWFGGHARLPGVALCKSLLPVLSFAAKSSPRKIRDCVGVRSILECLDEYTDVSDETPEGTTSSLFERGLNSELTGGIGLTKRERRYVVDVFLGTVMVLMAPGTRPDHVNSFLAYVSHNLDYDWEQDSQDLQNGKGEVYRDGARLERYLATVKASSVLLLLLRSRPEVPNLFESLSDCSGGVHGCTSWILCLMVNSFDDTIRALGLRCLDAYLSIAEPASESLVGGTSEAPALNPSSSQDSHMLEISPLVHKRAVKMLSATMTNVGKGLAVIGNSGVLPSIIPPSKLSVKIVYKLLWHLLKFHRDRLGEKTYAAMADLLLEDRAKNSPVGYYIDSYIVRRNANKMGYVLNAEFMNSLLNGKKSIASQTMRATPAVSTILRLLRFLPDNQKETWLRHLHLLVCQTRSNVAVLVENQDWQPCLFLLISEIVDEVKVNVSGEISEKHSASTTEDTETKNGVRNESSSIQIETHVERRYDLALKLYAALLGHCIRQGGEKGLDAVEMAASLQRVCVNGPEVFSLVLSHLLADLVAHGTVLDVGLHAEKRGISLQVEKTALKTSAEIVTKAILSSGTEGMDMAAAARHWRCLRHLTSVVVAVVTENGFGGDALFDYRNSNGSALDDFSGGMHGIRLPDGDVDGITASACAGVLRLINGEEERFSDRTAKEGGNDLLVSVTLAAQTLQTLDAFVFPDSLDASLPASQLHGLALVRSTESRLGLSQGPLLASLIRLSLVLLCKLEPSSVKFLQCCSRLRCFLHWTLELIREAVALAGYSGAFHDLTAPLDRLVLATVLHTHRALSRCSAVLAEIQETSYETYFSSTESKKRSHRRLYRVVFELREIVLAAYRGRNEVLKSALSIQAFEALQMSLEKVPSDRSRDTEEVKDGSKKEVVVRAFLSSPWARGFHDIEMRGNLAVPEQVSNGQASGHRTSSHRGLLAIEEISQESRSIVEDFNRGLNASFETYCERQRQWADTDAVRDLEYEGNMTTKRLSGQYSTDVNDSKKSMLDRGDAVGNRWDMIENDVVEVWHENHHWRFPKYTDPQSRRILLVQNRLFDDHQDASYELMLGREREKANREREERLKKQQQEEISAVVRRNEAAFAPYSEIDDDEIDDDNPDGLEQSDSDALVREDVTEDEDDEVVVAGDDDWDPIGAEELAAAKQNLDSDAWAKRFIWSDSESIVARFDSVVMVALRSVTEGKVLLTTHGLYFHSTGDETNVMTKESIIRPAPDRRWRLIRLTEVHGRRYMLKSQAAELFFSDGHEVFLSFRNGTRERDRFYAKLRNSCKAPMLRSPKSLNPRSVFKRSKVTELWRKRKISNFQYLMHLNFIAGRSFNDVSQYPVFPWVLADYKSESIDLSDSRVFRDLTKPVGALNPDRLAQLIQRYKDLESFGFPDQEKFLYGSHYSSPGVALHFLIRQEPFTTMAIELQSGRFDCPDRLFFDIAGCWDSCMTSSSDVKELIPEMFTCPEILLNTNGFPLGETQDGRDIQNVRLPPWAKGSAYEFIRIHREALESEYVSENLNHWIDLVFGYKQRGEEAEAAHNIFHYLSYEGSVDLDKIADEVDRVATESHIQNFGQTPSQLLAKEPHPRRLSASDTWKPLLANFSVPKLLRCHTPSKQFGGLRAGQSRGAVLSLHVTMDTVLAIYADLSVGAYKWAPTRNGGNLKMEKHRLLSNSCLSTSRSAMKRGSTAPQSMDSNGSHLAVGNWCFAMIPGGAARDGLRRRTAFSKIPPAKESPIAEQSSMIISCGYWDSRIKAHSLEGLKLRCSETGGHVGPILCLDIANDLLVTGGQDATCRVWVVDNPYLAHAVSDGYVKTGLGGKRGEHLLSCCHVLWGHTSAVTCLSLSSELDIVVSGSVDGNLCVHTVRRGSFLRSFQPVQVVSTSDSQTPVRKLALDSSGTLVVHCGDGGLHTYTINGVHICSKKVAETINVMRTCSSGKVLITGNNDGHVVVRTTHDLKVHSNLDLSRRGPVRSLALTPDELNPLPQLLFIGSDDGTVTVVDEKPSNLD